VASVFVSDLANSDLLEVWIYLAEDSEEASDGLIDEFASTSSRTTQAWGGFAMTSGHDCAASP
jgi:hypothetical protein